MSKYRIKTETIEATQWFKNGDHPRDGNERFDTGKFKGELYEGAIVRYFRTPSLFGNEKCRKCGNIAHSHGWIDGRKSPFGRTVCPGDYVITITNKENDDYFPMEPNVFEAIFKYQNGGENVRESDIGLQG